MGLFEDLSQTINYNLIFGCPVMSGNMSQHIKVVSKTNDTTTIEISGPSYDIFKWQRTGKIIHDGVYDYARDVNNYGGFFSMNESRGWVTRAVAAACYALAEQYNADVIMNVGDKI